MKCQCQYTIKVPQGNAFQVVFPMKTATWEHDRQVVEVAYVNALTNIAVKVDGQPWSNWEMEERGPLLTFPVDSLALGPHNVEVTAEYFGVDVRAAYFECITMVRWSYESNIGSYIAGSPYVAEAAYIYVGITDDQELEELKERLRQSILAYNHAKEEADAAKEAYDEKAEELDDIAHQSTMLHEFALTLEAIAGIHVDIPDNIATKQDVTAASTALINAIVSSKDAILEALSHISPEDPYSQALAAFFNITPPVPNAVPMTQQEVEDDLDELWNLIITQ